MAPIQQSFLPTAVLRIFTIVLVGWILACNPSPPSSPSPPPVNPLTAGFNYSATSGSPLQINFSNSSQGPVTTWRWDFGDGSAPVNSANPVYIYPGPGSYVVRLEVGDSGGNSDTIARRVTVYEAPPAGFTATPDSSDSQSIVFSGPPADVYAAPMGGTPPAASIDTWRWDFGDNTSQNGQSVTHRYAAQGRYAVTLQTSGPGGTSSETLDVVAGSAPPVVSFTTLANPNDPQALSFQNATTGNAASWLWDFGDNSTSTDQNPVHHYRQGGTYSVTQTATGSGGSDSITQSLLVVDRLPEPNMTFNALAGVPLGIQFTADAIERVTEWEWDFGDFSQTATQNPRHTYGTSGAYTVTLRARGPGGEGVITRVVSVGVSAPTVDFTHASGSGMYGVELTPIVSGTVNTLEVRFGDGNSETLTAANPGAPVFPPLSHNYVASGSYPVTMTAYGPAGDPSATQIIAIPEPALNPSITVTQSGGVAPLSIDFNGAATGNVQSWTWDFGDGNTATGEDVSHTYRSAGNYPAILTVAGPAGSATAAMNISVLSHLQAMADVMPISGEAPLTVSFSNQSTGTGALSYNWNFDDGRTSTDVNPTHTYRQPGTYLARLTVTDSAAPSQPDSITLAITVAAVPLAARIKVDRLEGSAPFAISVEDDSIGSVTGWRWDFGDNTPVFDTADPDLGRQRTHTYANPGRYPLILRVSGPLPAPENQDQVIREVIVRDPTLIPPTARINAVPVLGTSPHTIVFTNTSEGTYSSVLWDFDDGTNSTNANVTHTYATGGDYLVRLSLLGPPPNRLPLTSAAEVISVAVGPGPDLGPPINGSQGGVFTSAITRLSPGTGGTGSGAPATPGLPGSSDARRGPGWTQASVLRYEPMAGYTFADNYRIVRPGSAGQYATSIPCGQPCGTEACGLSLPSALGSSTDMVSLAMVADDGGTVYLSITEREEVAPAPDLRERFATTISTLSVSGALSAIQRTVLDANAHRNAMASVFSAGNQFLQSNQSSLIVDDLILLASGTLVVVGRLRFYFDYGSGGPLGIDELPGLFAISPTTGALQWSLYGDMYQPQRYETTEVRANIVGNRFLIWVLRGNAYSATQVDGVLYEGRVPANGEYLPAPKAADLINDYNLVDYAIGPDENIFAVVREEMPLACYDETLDNYQLRIFDKHFSRELANPTPLDLDYDPRFYFSYFNYYYNPRLQSQRRLFVEPDGSEVRVVLHGTVWPDKKVECALYKGSAAYPYPAFGDGCPAEIINNYCCDDPNVAARHPGVCTGVADKGDCPCRGVDPDQEHCTNSNAYNIEACEREFSTFALEQIIFGSGSGPFPLVANGSRHTIAAAPEGGFYAAADAPGVFVEPLTLTSDGRGRVTYIANNGAAVIRLDDPDNPDLEVTTTDWAATGSVLTDRSAMPISIHGGLGSLRVFRHNPALGVNNEVSWAWPNTNYQGASLVLPVGSGRLLRLSGNITSSLIVNLYEPANMWLGPVFEDHNAPAPDITPCLDSAAGCGTEYTFFSTPHRIWDNFSFCRRWLPHPECDNRFLDRWDHQNVSSRSWRMPHISGRLAIDRGGGLLSLPVSQSSIWIPSTRQTNATNRIGGVQPRCRDLSSRQVATRTVCINYDSNQNVCLQTELQEQKEFRCEQQDEVLVPVWQDAGISPLSGGWQRFHIRSSMADQCSEVGLATPVLTVNFPGPNFRVTESTAGNTATLSITRPSAGELTLKVISGDAQLANGTDEMAFAGAGNISTTVQAGDSRTAIVQATWIEQVMHHREQQSVAISFQRTGLACRAEGSRFRQCTVRHPGPVLAPVDQPARHAPATVGQDVDLSTRAIWQSEIDAILPSIDMALIVSRHYIPPRRPTVASPDPSYNPLDEGAELGPGWRLNLIQWLLPITPNTASSALEDPASGFNMALHADGRVDTFRYPASGPVAGPLSGDNRIFLYDESTGALFEKRIAASVVTYISPPGYQGTLRSYTIALDANGGTTAIHPYYDASRAEVAPDEQRFYVLTDFDGQMRVFNCKGQLIRIISPRRHEMRFIYEGPRDRNTNLRVLSGVVDTNGRLTRLIWYRKAAGPRIDSIILPDGRKIEFTYRSSPQRPGRLAAVVRNFDARVALSTSPNPPPIDPAVRLRHGYGYTADGLLRFIFVQQEGRQVTVLKNGYQDQDIIWQETGAGRANDSAGLARDGGLMQIEYTSSGAVVTDANGVDRVYELSHLSGSNSARVVRAMTIDAEVYNGDFRNPANSLQALRTTYDYDSQGYVNVVDPPGPGSTTTTYNDHGDLTTRIETAGADSRTWTYNYSYDGPCLLQIQEIDHAGATTVTDYYPFDVSKPGQICQLKSITQPTVTDPASPAVSHTYKTTYEYYGAQQNASSDDRLLRGALAGKTLSEDGGSDSVQETSFTYWITSGGGAVTGISGRTAYTRLGLAKLITVTGDIPGRCSGNVLPRRETYHEYDERGNLRLVRYWITGPQNPLQTPAQATEALEERRIYDQANRLYSLTQNGISTTYTFNERDQLVEITRSAEDLFNGAGLNWPTTNPPARKIVERRLYQHNGDQFATLTGIQVAGNDPEFNSFVFTAYDGENQPVLTIEPGPGLSDSERFRIIRALLNACPGQRTPSTNRTCPSQAIADAGWDNLSIRQSDINTNGAPLRFEGTEYTKDGFISSQRVHNGTHGLAPNTAGQLTRVFMDNERQIRLTESGAMGKNNVPVRETNSYTGFGELAESVLYDPDGCGTGYTAIRKTTYQDRDTMGRPQTIIVTGDDGRVADVNASSINSVCTVNTELSRMQVNYDEIGRLKTTTRHVHVINGLGTGQTGPGASQTVAFSYTYGPFGGVTAEKVGSKVERSYFDYTGSLCASTTASGAGNTPLKEIDYKLDGLSRVTSETTRHIDIAGHGLGEPTLTVEYRYGAHGNRNLVKDGLKRETRRHFDALGRLRVEEIFNDSGQQIRQQELRYDDFGNLWQELTTTTDGRRGIQRSFIGRHLIEETTTVDGAWASRRRFVLDYEARPIKIFPHGDDDEVLIRELDAIGQIRRETLTIAGADVAIKTFEYDALGNVTQLAAVDQSQPRIAPWDETKRYRYNGLGHLTFAQNEISDPRDPANNARNGVVSNVWIVRDSLGKARQEGIKLFDRDVAVTDRDHIVDAGYDAVGKIKSLDYDADINPANRPRLTYGYDAGLRLTTIGVTAGMPVDRFEMKYSGDYVMQRQWFDQSGNPGHITIYSFDRLLRRYKVEHTLNDERVESRQWYRNGLPIWTRNVSWRKDGNSWIPNADDNLMAYPQNQCNNQPGARLVGGQYAIAEITTDSCFNTENAVRVMARSGWDIVDETGVIGSHFSGTQRDAMGRVLSQTSINYAGEIDDDAAPSVARRRLRRIGGRIAQEQKVEIGAAVTGLISSSLDWRVRAITDATHAYQGLPLVSGIRCDNAVGNLDAADFRRLCGTREYRFVQPPINRFPGADKPFDAINIAGIWRVSELKQDQIAGMTANPPTAPGGPEPALYRSRFGPIGGPNQLQDEITQVRKYDIEYDLFGRQVLLHDNHYLGPKAPGAGRVTHRYFYDALDRLIYEDYQGLDIRADDITYAPTFYGYYGKNLIRERIHHPDYNHVSDRVYVYGPGADLVYTARMGENWNGNSDPPIAHLVLEDVDNSILSLYYRRGTDSAYHRQGGEIRGFKVRNYIQGEVDRSTRSVFPWWNAAIAAGVTLDDDKLKESFKQFSPLVRSSPFDQMVYSAGSGFMRSRTASWRTEEWVAQEATQGEWLQEAAQHRLIATGALVAAAILSAGYGAVGFSALAAGEAGGLSYLAAGTAISLSTEAISAYGLYGSVQDVGWTDANKSEAGWIGFGVATDLATLGGTRFIQLARAAETAQNAALAYQIANISWSAMGMDAALGDNCFTAGTLVWTEDGLRPIETIHVGDRVWSMDQHSGETMLQPVLQTFINSGTDFVILNLNGEQIKTTPAHPFWVADRGWVLAADLVDGDQLLTDDGPTGVSIAGAVSGNPVPVFNFDVAGADTYFVGQSRLLVHNTSFNMQRLKRISQQISKAPRTVARTLEDIPPTPLQKLRALQGRRISQAAGRFAAIKTGLGEWRRERVLITSTIAGKRVRKIWNGRERYFLNLDEFRKSAQIVNGVLVKSGIERLSARAWEGIMLMSTGKRSSVLKRQVQYVLRNGGGKHEMLPVGMFAHMAKLGVSLKDIHRLTMPTRGLKFRFPGIAAGSHHGSNVGRFAHKLLFAELREATTKRQAFRIALEFHKRFAFY